MLIELIGGPLDGSIVDGPSHFPVYILISDHDEGPIYRFVQSCGHKRYAAAYYFLGYEQSICYDYPERSQGIKAIDQKNYHLSDFEPRA